MNLGPLLSLGMSLTIQQPQPFIVPVDSRNYTVQYPIGFVATNYSDWTIQVSTNLQTFTDTGMSWDTNGLVTFDAHNYPIYYFRICFKPK